MIDKTKTTFSKEEKAEIQNRLRVYSQNLGKHAARDEQAIYSGEISNRFEYRTNFGQDVDNILNNSFYARFGDKTQVHSFYKNDDLTRRSLHVQFLSKIARGIGIVLNLNLELIEAISLGHDIGHTPFGHRGEAFLSALYKDRDGKLFNHNVHSVRVLYDISKKANKRGISLQTLDGILCHNGELLVDEIVPDSLSTFEEFDVKYKKGYTDAEVLKTYRANTVEGCLVRICDILAYVGKDRQDLIKVGTPDKFRKFADHGIGLTNQQILSAVVPNLIKNSLDKPYIKLDKEVAKALDQAKKDNYEVIYNSKEVTNQYKSLEILFERVFVAAIKDLEKGTDNTYIRRNYLDASYLELYRADIAEGRYSHADIAVDYIACMTDDYFVDLCAEMGFAESGDIRYKGYFEIKEKEI